ncbi:MAG: ABC transporter ATP-binding protein, partial [Erysipelotrichaceae bacterium]
LLNPLSYTLINIAIVFILYYGGIQVNIGVLSQGQIVAFVNYMTQILFALLALTKLIILFTKASASSIRVNEILELPIMSSGTKTNIEDNETIVEFKDVNFKYPNAKNNVLSNINFTINKNETVGIIGGTGSGKTTIISLILKFYKTSSGTINYYDEPINNYEAKALRNSISICPQNAMLINDSIVDNLKIANIDATNDEIQQALNTALAAEFVNSYPYNIHTIIEQGGKNLSGGQLQRLCIARTLLRKTNLYIFDDSFSALDYNSESIILNNLKKIKSSKLFITQKVNTISDCDKIIVLDNSRIVGCGTHIQLLNSCNVYKEIYDSQNLSEVGSND